MRRETLLLLVVVGCGAGPSPTAKAPPSADDRAREAAQEFARLEDHVIEMLAAADPRIATRAGVTPSEETVKRLGTESVLAEDTTLNVRNGSLDLFSFAARARAVEASARALATWKEPLTDPAPKGSALERPRLERELVARLVEEERARTAEEQKLGDASADLVRGMWSTWTPPASPLEWQERDEWAAKRLNDVRGSLPTSSRAGRADLDVALDPMERLFVPMQFPRAVKALLELRLAVEQQDPGEPGPMPAERVVARLKSRLGVSPEPAALRATLERVVATMRPAIDQAVAGLAGQREELTRASVDLMFKDADCGATPDAPRADGSRLRAMHPPAERAPICGTLRAVASGVEPGGAMAREKLPAMIALHDEIVVALWALGGPPRSGVAFAVDDEVGVHMRRLVAARPEVPLGVAAALDLLLRGGAGDPAPRRAERWLAFGDAPLDVIERELFAR